MDKVRVLIVDDDSEGIMLLRHDLEEAGIYEVFEETRGLRALDAVWKFRPEIILLDVMIPDLDGPTIASLIEKENLNPKPVIVFLTSIVSPEEASRGDIGGYRFLSKDASRETTLGFLADLSERVHSH